MGGAGSVRSSFGMRSTRFLFHTRRDSRPSCALIDLERILNRALLGLVAVAAIAVMESSAHAITYLAPTPYMRAGDTPFTGPFDWFRLENFETGALAQRHSPGLAIDHPDP